jgi:hypothetical protein
MDDSTMIKEILDKLPMILQGIAENQLLMVKASDESNKHINKELEGIKSVLAQLMDQVSLLVQYLQQQQKML